MTTKNHTQSIVAGGALLLIIALACAAAKSIQLFVVVTYLLFACWYIAKPDTQPRRHRQQHGRDTTGAHTDASYLRRDVRAFAGAGNRRWSKFEAFDFDELGLYDSPDDFPRRSASEIYATGYDEFGRDLSGRDIHEQDHFGYDSMGYDACGYDRAGHPEHEDHLFHDFIDSGNQIDSDWLSTPCWE